MSKQMEYVEFVWNSGDGPIPDQVAVFGSWDEYTEPVPTTFDGDRRFHGKILLPMPGNFYYCTSRPSLSVSSIPLTQCT